MSITSPPAGVFSVLADQFRQLHTEGPQLALWFTGGEADDDRPEPFAFESAFARNVGHPFSAPCSHPSTDPSNLARFSSAALTTNGVSVRNGTPVPNPDAVEKFRHLRPLASQAARHLTPEQLLPFCRWVGDAFTIQLDRLNHDQLQHMTPEARTRLEEGIRNQETGACLSRAITANSETGCWVWLSFVFGTLSADPRWVRHYPNGCMVNPDSPGLPGAGRGVPSVPCAKLSDVVLASVEVLTRLSLPAQTPAGTSQATGEGGTPKEQPPPDPFAELRGWARRELKGQQRAVVESLCDAGGELTLAALAVKDGVNWTDPPEQFKGVQRRLQGKDGKPWFKEGWRIERHDNSARLTPVKGAKVGRKSSLVAPD